MEHRADVSATAHNTRSVNSAPVTFYYRYEIPRREYASMLSSCNCMNASDRRTDKLLARTISTDQQVRAECEMHWNSVCTFLSIKSYQFAVKMIQVGY